MNDWLIMVLAVAAACLLGAMALLYFMFRREQGRREILEERVGKIARLLEEMVQLNESAYRSMTQTIRTLETGIQKTDRSAPPSPVEKKHKILNLFQKGIPAEEISRRLNVPRGEVDLVASLDHWSARDGELAARPH